MGTPSSWLDDDALDVAFQSRPLSRPGHRLCPRTGRKDRYILAESRLGAYYKEGKGPRLSGVGREPSSAASNTEPLFPYFASLREPRDSSRGDSSRGGAFRTLTGAHVTTEDGTGIVHTAPGFGEEDHEVMRVRACRRSADRRQCRFTEEVGDYAGIFVKDADKAIMERLKAEGKPSAASSIARLSPLLALRPSSDLPCDRFLVRKHRPD